MTEETVELREVMKEPKEVDYRHIDPRITPADLKAWDEILDPLITGTLEEGEVLAWAVKIEPFHHAHGLILYAGAKIANLYDEDPKNRRKFAIVIGDPQEEHPLYGSEVDQRYPFSYDERVEMVRDAARQIGLSEEAIVENLIPVSIRDVNDNKKWCAKVIYEIENVRGLGTIRHVLANDDDTTRSTQIAFREYGNKNILVLPRLEGQETGTQIRERNRRDGIFAPGGSHKVVGRPGV